MQICIASVFVSDQDRTLAFYAEKLGFAKKADIPLGEYRWLTVIAPNGVILSRFSSPTSTPQPRPTCKARTRFR